MENVIIVIILLLVIGTAIYYIAKSKRSGVKCIGCPSAGKCAGSGENHSGCNCGMTIDK